MDTKTVAFSSLEEVQNYFAGKDVSRMDVREAVETKYIAKSILAALQEYGAPALVTNFWHLLQRLAEERLKTLDYKIVDMPFGTVTKIVHIVPADLMRAKPHTVARQMFEGFSDEKLEELLNQALETRPLNTDLLNMLRTEYARRNKLN